MQPKVVFHRLAGLAMTSSVLAILSPKASAQIAFNFEDFRVPAGTAIYEAASIDSDGSGQNTCLHLTETVNSQSGHFRVAKVGEGKSVRQIRVQWRSLIGSGGGADGYSLNWATDLPATPTYNSPGEEGAGSGLSVTVDTFDNGGGEAPGLEIRWQTTNLLASVAVPNDDIGGSTTYLRRGEFVNAEVTVDTSGLATFTYDGVSISAQLDGWKGISGGDLMWSARTGGANDRHWIDDVRVTTGIFPAGPYTGLWGDGDERTHERRGAVNLKLTAQGAYSGTLMLGGSRLPIAGRFAPETARSVVSILRPGTTTLTVDLTLQDRDTIVGSVGDGTWTERLWADRLVWDKKLNPATNHVGQYVARVFAGRGSDVPNGFGYGTLTVDAAGGVKFAGVLGDGSKVTQKTALSPRGTWPIYFLTHGGQGTLQGWLALRNNRVTENEVAWFRSPVPGALYPAGFSLHPDMAAAPYRPPAAGDRVLPFANGTAAFASGEVEFTSPIALTAANQIIGLGDDKLSVKFVPKTGLFSGTVMVPRSTTKLKFAGVMFPPYAAAYGNFLGTAECGAVWFYSVR